MFRLSRLLFVVALAVYLGGLIGLGPIAAPAVFKTLQDSGAVTATSNPALTNPKQLGGEIFGNVLRQFAVLESGCVLAMMLGVVGESLLRGRAMLRKPWHWLRIVLVAGVAGLLVYDAVIVYPKVVAKRAEWRAAMGTAKADELQGQFDGLHRRAESIGHGKAYLLLALLGLTTLASTVVPAKPAATKPAGPR